MAGSCNQKTTDGVITFACLKDAGHEGAHGWEGQTEAVKGRFDQILDGMAAWDERGHAEKSVKPPVVVPKTVNVNLQQGELGEDMAIIATAGTTKKYTPAPAGLHSGVCVDVVDLGLEPNRFEEGKKVHKVRIIWQLDEGNPDTGDLFTVAGKWTLSLNKKASLRPFLAAWRGRDFTAEEEKGFDVESLVGVPCMVNVLHNVGEDGTLYANVASVSLLPKGTKALKPSSTYVRVKDRPPRGDEPSVPF